MSTLSKQLTNIPKSQLQKLVALVLILGTPLIIGFLLYLQFNVWLVLIAVVFLGIAVLMFIWPEATTVVVLFVMYVNLAVVAIRFFGVPELLSVSFFLLLGLPLINYVIIRRQKLITNRIMLVMLLYLGLLLISAVFSEQPGESTNRIAAYAVEGLALYVLIINTVRTPEVLRLGVWALILAGAFMGSLSLYQELTGSYDNDFWGLAQVKVAEIDTGEVDYLGVDIQRRRLAGPIGSKNRYAQIMVVLFPLALMRLWIERSRILRMLAIAVCIPIISGALLTFSRGAGVSIAITLVAMVYLRVIKLWHFVILSIAAIVLVLLAVPDYVYRISTAVDVAELASGNVDEAGGSIQGRATVNLAAFNIFLDHPLFGVGPGQTNLYTREYGNELGIRTLEGDRRAHNMYLEELADTGVVGFAAFLAILLITMLQLWQVRRRWKMSRTDISLS
ncbi:MAG: O-antigen ligase family protein, partial [Candidatus Promineifilaceae bacterium]